MSHFVHLHSHSEYSILDGMSRVEEIVDKAIEYGHEAVSLTDHGHMGNVPTFYNYAKEKGIKPIIGQEFYITEDAKQNDKNEQRNHITLLALNSDGYKTLCKLSTTASEHFYYKPRLDRNILRSFSSEYDNIVALSGCMFSQLSQAILMGDDKASRKLLQFYNVVFPNFYLEFMKHGYKRPKLQEEFTFSKNEDKINDKLWEYHERYNIPIVVTNDSHYIDKEDQDDHEILLAIQTGSDLKNPKRFKFNGHGYYFCDAKSLRKKFSKAIWRESEKSMEEIVKRVDMKLAEFDDKEHFIPSFGLKEPDKELRRLCLQGLKDRVPKKKRKQYKKELEYQLGVINECEYSDEFLIVLDYVNFARNNNVTVGAGRGSMVGVLVSYLMGITDIDPIRFELSFERALNPARPSLPDFDIDFSDKDIVIDYLRNKYGHDNTMQIGTYSRMHYRSLLRALLRVFGYDFKTSVNYTKMLPDVVDIIADKAPTDFDELIESSPEELSNLFYNDEKLTHLMKKFNGLVQSMGTHAGGLLIGDDKLKLREIIPTYKVSQERELISQFDKKVVEKQLGLVKFDILGITTLEIIQKCLELIGENIFDKFPDGDKLKDPKVFDLINSGNLTYIFQLDGPANRIAMNAIGGIHEFEDIVITTSVARPGTSQFIPELAQNKKQKKQTYVEEDLRPIMENSHGVLLYQEQVMAMGKNLAGFDMVQVDDIKEMIKGKDHAKFEEMKPKFIKGCGKNGYNEETANLLWSIIEKASGYLYNRSHAVSYSVITYQTAYLKAHYPLEFFVACMNISKPSDDKIKRLIQESFSMGIEILPPDIHKSNTHAVIEDGKVRLGLSMVKNIGITTANNIVWARQKDGARGLRELPRRVMSSRVLASLRDVGAFGAEHADPEREIELLGFQLNDPIKEFTPFIEKHSRETDHDTVFGGTVTKVRRMKTKRGDDMAFVDVTTKTEVKNIAMFSEQLSRWGHIMKHGNVLLVRADKQDNYDSVIPNKVRVLKDG